MYFWNNFFIPIPLWSTRIPRKVVFLEGLNNISGHFKVRSSQLDLLRGLIDKITTGYICDSNSFQREMLFIAAFSQNREQFILRFIWSCTFPTYTGWFLFSLPELQSFLHRSHVTGHSSDNGHFYGRERCLWDQGLNWGGEVKDGGEGAGAEGGGAGFPLGWRSPAAK